ncbi:MAG TPA: hypothetical protein GX715_06155 [Armatimonadetes bacterium]|nr:hypothetical protein [Armatimonadota bacterium]
MLRDELTPEQRDEVTEKLAARVVERRLESVATLFLELNKPIAFIGGQALLVGAPIFGTLFGYENMQRLALYFQSPENVERLLVRIEELSQERDAREKGGAEPSAEGSP